MTETYDEKKKKILKTIKDQHIKFVDLRFTTTFGKEQHITIPVSALTDDFWTDGKAVDGSSFHGWKEIHDSDVFVKPDLSAAVSHDPFYQEATILLRCDVMDPETTSEYDRCPRSIAKRAEAYLKSTGIADLAFFGPEPEFFLFDDVRFNTHMSGSFYKINSEEAHWNSGEAIEGGNIGHRPSVKGGYSPVPPVDSSHDIRAHMCTILESLDIVVEAHHHEVATANQCEIATKFASLVTKADQVQLLKYVVHNVAHQHGKTATFMPKPLVGDNGSGMHCHQSLMKDGVNLFAGDKYDGLSELGLYYIGGILKHAKALNALTNPATNSYKRLVVGFEAPVFLSYSAKNRSAAIRIPHCPNPKGRRIEVRFPDCAANPYLAFSAMMMAGLDGIINKIDPGAAVDKNLFDLLPEEHKNIAKVSASLEQAIEHLKADNAFLLQGNVFSPAFLESYIRLKQAEIQKMAILTHPYEFELYYSV